MADTKPAPTKTNLLKTKQELQFAKLGYELLDQKRNILINELLTIVDQAVEHQEKIDKSLAEAYSTMEEGVLSMGRRKVANLSGAVNITNNVTIRERKVMGVALPVVDTEFTEKPPFYSPMGTSFWVDQSLIQFKQTLQIIGRLVELKVSLIRLANEVKKTIRKVNALEKIAIPSFKENLDFIQNRLEENERDMFVLMKQVKRRMQQSGDSMDI